MKKLIKKGVSFMVLSAFIFSPMISTAQLNSNLVGEVKADIGKTIDTSVETSVKTESDINTKTDVYTDIKINSVGSSTNNEEVESNSNTSLRTNSSGVAIISSAQINSESDLDIFTVNVSAKNKEVANVDINSSEEGKSEVKVVYKHKGKFLGFIPITIKSTTIVESKTDAEAEVNSKLPWWSFLVSNKNYVKADIESNIKNDATVKANAKVDASAQAKAQVAEVIIAEVRASTNTQASINN